MEANQIVHFIIKVAVNAKPRGIVETNAYSIIDIVTNGTTVISGKLKIVPDIRKAEVLSQTGDRSNSGRGPTSVC